MKLHVVTCSEQPPNSPPEDPVLQDVSFALSQPLGPDSVHIGMGGACTVELKAFSGLPCHSCSSQNPPSPLESRVGKDRHDGIPIKQPNSSTIRQSPPATEMLTRTFFRRLRITRLYSSDSRIGNPSPRPDTAGHDTPRKPPPLNPTITNDPLQQPPKASTPPSLTSSQNLTHRGPGLAGSFGGEQELGVGEIASAKFRIEPLRRQGEDLPTMRARLLCTSPPPTSPHNPHS